MRVVRAISGAVLGLGFLAACGTSQPEQHIDNGALVRLNEAQMQPVDDARVEEGRARDNLARAKAGTADAMAKIDIAKAEHDVAAAQAKRAKAEYDLLVSQKADLKDIDRAKNDFMMAQQRVQAVDLKIDYLHHTAGIAQMDEQVAAQHTVVTAAATERAKYQALQAANSNEIRGMNPAAIDAKLAAAQAREAQLRKEAADQRVVLVDSYNKWQEVDAKVRTMPTAAPAAPMAAPMPMAQPQPAQQPMPADQAPPPPAPAEQLPAQPMTH